MSGPRSTSPAEPVADPDTVPTTVLRRHGLPPRRPSGRLWAYATLVALFAVVMLVAAWRTLQGHDATPSPAPPAVGPPVAAPTTAPPATRSPTAGSSAPTDAGTPASSPSPSRSTGSPVVAGPRWNRTVEVVVLNATRRTGLAAAAAQRLRAKGWPVSSIGNWRGGGVSRTTVFAPRFPRAVLTLQHDVPSARGHRRPLPGMPTDRLVLVLGEDYRG